MHEIIDRMLISIPGSIGSLMLKKNNKYRNKKNPTQNNTVE